MRKLGHAPAADTITIESDTELSKQYQLLAAITELDSVRVEGASVRLTPAMRTFERRRESGIGTFIPPEDLRKNDEQPLRYILARIPGLRFVTYQSATFLASARGAPSNDLPPAIPWDRNSPRRCWVQIYYNAIRLYVPMTAVRGSPGEPQPVPNIEDYRIRDLEAIEFYAGPAQTPSELGGMGATCGTLVLWTREK